MQKTSQAQTGFMKSPFFIMAIILMAIAGVIVVQSFSRGSDNFPKEVSVSKAAEMREAGAIFLDVRQPEEWNQSHIPGSTLIPLGELQNRINEVPKDIEIVVVCRTGRRSAQGRDILINAGFINVTSMTGGVNQWQSKGMPVVSGE